MGYIWYAIACYVHFNALLLVVLMLPFPKPKHWKILADFCVFQFVRNHIWCIYALFGVTSAVLFLDAVGSYNKYIDPAIYLDLNNQDQKEVRLKSLIAQRNYYLSGLAVVLSILTPRLTSIFAEHAELQKKTDAVGSALKVFKHLIDVMESQPDTDKEKEESLDGKILVLSIKDELAKLTRRDTTVAPDETAAIDSAIVENLLKQYEQRKKDRLDQVNNNNREEQNNDNTSSFHPSITFPTPRQFSQRRQRFSAF